MIDRYSKCVLSVIAGALTYLCVVMTPLPGLSAQTNSPRPGQPSGPTEVVIVGWRTPGAEAAFPVSIQHPVRVTATEPFPIRGSVTTERSSGRADRVILVGWERHASRDSVSPMHGLPETSSSASPSPLPVKIVP